MANLCEYSQDLDNFLDGALDTDRRKLLEAHLNSCTTCKAAIEAATELRKLMQHAAADKHVPHLWSSVKKKLPQMCQVVREDLSAFLDSELATEGVSTIDAHLAKCQNCSQQLEQMNAVDRLLARGLALPASVTV